MFDDRAAFGKVFRCQCSESHWSLQIDFDGLVEERFGHPANSRRRRCDARIVHQHVEVTHFIQSASDQRFAFIPTTDVTRDSNGFPAERSYVFRHSFTGLKFATSYDDIGTSFGITESNGPTQTFAATCHHRHLSI